MEVGAVNTLIVMPRPLEMTGKNEFPLYDVLSPCLTTWLHVSERLFDAINEVICSAYYTVIGSLFAFISICIVIFYLCIHSYIYLYIYNISSSKLYNLYLHLYICM